MDRIAALRNIEDALSDFETGEIDLTTLDERVRGVLRTYATEFSDDRRAVYQVAGTVVVAESPGAARQKVAELTTQTNAQQATVERLSE